MSRITDSILVFSLGLLVASPALFAKGKHAKTKQSDPQDEITVVAHLPLPDGPVTQFLTTQHYRRDYLYASRGSGNEVTLIDVTDVDHPAILAETTYPEGSRAGATDKLVAGTGSALLVSDGHSQSEVAPASAPSTFRIMNFADPAHPALKQEFKGVTAMTRNEKRGLIYLANGDGIWILQQRFAQDPESEKEWEHMMLDAR